MMDCEDKFSRKNLMSSGFTYEPVRCCDLEEHPLNFVMEIGGQNFKSMREPLNFEELMQAAHSLIEHKNTILGLISTQKN